MLLLNVIAQCYCSKLLLNVIAQCYCSMLLLNVIAQSYCSMLLHNVIAQCYCTMLLLNVIAQLKYEYVPKPQTTVLLENKAQPVKPLGRFFRNFSFCNCNLHTC